MNRLQQAQADLKEIQAIVDATKHPTPDQLERLKNAQNAVALASKT